MQTLHPVSYPSFRKLYKNAALCVFFARKAVSPL